MPCVVSVFPARRQDHLSRIEYARMRSTKERALASVDCALLHGALATAHLDVDLRFPGTGTDAEVNLLIKRDVLLSY